MDSEIAVSGGSKLQRELVAEAASFYLKKLLPHNYYEVMLVIKLRKDYYERCGCRADVMWEDDEDEPREFEINIDASMQIHGLLRALAHECAHVKQYVLGELRDTSSLHVIVWKKKKYDTRKIDYYDLPWEFDAYGREVGLHANFSQQKKFKNASWNKYDPDYIRK